VRNLPSTSTEGQRRPTAFDGALQSLTARCDSRLRWKLATSLKRTSTRAISRNRRLPIYFYSVFKWVFPDYWNTTPLSFPLFWLLFRRVSLLFNKKLRRQLSNRLPWKIDLCSSMMPSSIGIRSACRFGDVVVKALRARCDVREITHTFGRRSATGRFP
jgi:hypothetical protein